MLPFMLSTTQTMAAQGFLPYVLRVMEADALRCAHISLASKGRPPQTMGDLVAEAESMIPRSGAPDAMQLFFSTHHAMQDSPFDDLTACVALTYRRAKVVQQLSQAELFSGNVPTGGWHAVGESLAFELAEYLTLADDLADRGALATRRLPHLESLRARPLDPAVAGLYDRARQMMTEEDEHTARHAPQP